MKISFTPDQEVKIHETNAIRLICSSFRSHESGLPEWIKNSSDAYASNNIASEHRTIVVIFQQKKGNHPAYIACLDLVGMETSDIEDRFRHWADPSAASRGGDSEEIQGGHGNGGKCYMTQMFDKYSLIHTVKEKKGNRYGFVSGTTVPGYFPDREQGRNFAVPDSSKELARILKEVRINIKSLPESALTSLEQSEGFTLVQGFGPKGFGNGKIPTRSLIENLSHHPQMIRTIQICKIFIIADGKLYNNEPLKLEDIEPLSEAKKPRIIEVPEQLIDPVTTETISTISKHYPEKGQLILQTSAKSMTHSLRYRHCIGYKAKGHAVGFKDVKEFTRSYYADRIYGYCTLNILEEYKLNERQNLADSPLTRAVENWIYEQIEAYAKEFVKLDRLKASQEQKEELKKMNSILNEWKNQFLKDLGLGISGEMTGTRGTKPGKEPLPKMTPSRLHLSLPYKKAGVNISFRPKLDFFADDKRVRSVPYRWCSSDWNVATVDDELLLINTHSPGETEIWAETLTGKLASNKVSLNVVKIKSIKLEPSHMQIPSGQRKLVKAIVTIRDGTENEDVYLMWDENNSNVATVTPIGMVYAREQGTTEISAFDDNCIASIGTVVEVLPSSGKGGGQGASYPQILLSKIDDDPLNLDEEVIFAPEEGTICQRVNDVDANIWWINTATPLAVRFLDENTGYGSKSKEWRFYHLERYIEALVKIKLNHSFLSGEELPFDTIERRWSEEASNIQLKVVQELNKFIEEGELPYGL